MGIYLLSFYTQQIIREDFFSVRDGRILLKQHTYIVFEFIACIQPFAHRGTYVVYCISIPFFIIRKGFFNRFLCKSRTKNITCLQLHIHILKKLVLKTH